MEKQSKEKEVQLQELEEIVPMGSGAFGLVTLVRHRPTGHTYALKAVNKEYLQKTRTGPLLKREVREE
jgi:serine/threonine protein kinase